MPNVLIIGATRGLGYQIALQYAQREYSVTGTARSAPPKETHHDIHWISGVDVATEAAGKTISEGLKGHKQDLVIITAGFFGKESFDEPDYDAEVTMYKTSAIAPVFIVHHLHKAESGSITLRHETEGGGMFGHHASKAASNMVGKLLSLDLKDQGIAVGIVHPGFMRTEMTRSVGFDQFWDDGGAVTPDEAAESLIRWIEEEFDMSKTGQYWAPRGAADIGTAEAVMGAKKGDLPTPLQLPW
ncbi:hypothetical protein LTR91_017063 [Friedmanniomyces endolithicus]|uniref:Oxidoreductase n=1 Tax=Friedmanniomyces endolithicus TaxID=329885 RepID=A0AAN6K6Q8_9PEZI|nr:hypothetical protein LTR57_021056 [Friedmanniomyces endolithicus]KAK0965044.1 hypothetical protein LTS01_018521 [Friedmanniomyces endolithicus]KAK0967587.1 hypothetical protein LTR91_017063 [Friedmanniomyces endolithicus]KAK1029629.1 hypothetical protein LTS16_019578 [Friedmanniomyces endolithicus]